MNFFTQQGRSLLLVCLIVVVSVFGVVYAQQFIRLETCHFCKGTGRFPCLRCLGKGCQECGFSGVVKSPCVGRNRPYTCCICDGEGKEKIDTRFEKCNRKLFRPPAGSDRFTEGYECPDGHPIGKVVIVDAYNNGNILKKYSTTAEFEAVEKAEIEAELAPKRAEEAAKKKAQEDEKERIRQARLEREKIKNSRQPFTDTRDGKKYLTVKIGGKTWMAENLNYETGKSWCYDKRNSNCDKYGRLYDWKTAMKACPTGYHLPSREEWKALVDYAGGKEAAGEKLKTKDGWANMLSDVDVDGGKRYGTDEYGFSALPSGYRSGGFGGMGLGGVWWTATESGGGKVYRQSMTFNNDNVNESNDNKSDGYSVRCVAD